MILIIRSDCVADAELLIKSEIEGEIDQDILRPEPTNSMFFYDAADAQESTKVGSRMNTIKLDLTHNLPYDNDFNCLGSGWARGCGRHLVPVSVLVSYRFKKKFKRTETPG